MRWTRLLVVVLSLAFTSGLVLYSVQAKSECTSAHDLEQGAPALCRGVLFPRDWALQAIACVQLDLPQAEAERASAMAGEADCQNTMRSLQTAYESHLTEYEKLTRRAAGLSHKPWYESPILWFGVGLAGGVGVAVLLRQ